MNVAVPIVGTPVERTRPVNQSGVRRIGFVLGLAYVATVFARLPELIANPIVTALHLPLVTLGIVTAITVAHCGLTRVLTNRSNVLLILFTLWMMVCVPLSTYRGGSVNMLLHVWADTALLSICLATLPDNVQECRRFMNALGVGTALIVLSYAFLGNSADRGLIDTGGTLGNPNILAMQLELGLPFLFAPFARRNWLISAFVLFFAGCSLAITLKTGSRAGILGLAAMGFIIFLISAPSRKLIFGLGAPLLVVLAFFALPTDVIKRYSTLFGDDSADVSAAQSSRARRQHLEQSWRLSLANPIFGVGPGVFVVAAAEESKDRSERAAWRETHNSFTQVSSETGFPGFILYIALLLSWFVPVLRLYKKTRRDPRFADLNRLSVLVLMACVATLINANFSSTAYNIYLPALGGLAVALVRCGSAELKRPVPATVSAPAAPSPLKSVVPVQAAPPAAARMRNPVRFGRPRVPGGISGPTGNGGSRNTAG